MAVGRPAIDVVVPFRGTRADLQRLRYSLRRLRLRGGDSVVVVDNTPGVRRGARTRDAAPSVIRAAEVPAPGYARNRGVEAGQAEWLVFFDADATPSPDLLDRYLAEEPGERTALLAGGVLDQPVPPRGSLLARYAHLKGGMSQDIMMGRGEWAFPMSANVACRREAFEAVGGFRSDIRAAEDADLAYRLRAAGWEVERREQASVVHRNRRTVRGFVIQKMVWGAGTGWLEREYPGSSPPRARRVLLEWALEDGRTKLAAALRNRDRDAALMAVLEPLEQVLYEFSRVLPNERPLPARSPWRLLGLG